MRNTALGSHTEMLGIKVNVFDIEIDEFLQSDAGSQEYLDNDPEKPQTMFSGSLMHDFQADHATNSFIPQELNVPIDAEDINMATLVRMGR